MFFLLSKVLFFVVAPSHLCLIAFAVGMLMLVREKSQRSARWLLMASLSGFIILGFSPVGKAMMYVLEERFPPPDLKREGPFAGVIVLGGFEDGNLTHARGSLTLVDAAERLTEAVRVANQLPAAKVIYTGGAVSILLPGYSAGGAIGAYFQDVGIAKQRIVIESKSRNTWENAIFTKPLLKSNPLGKYLLVTSAWHMPRAMGVFRKAGYNVVAFPVDYRTGGAHDLSRPFSFMADGLKRVDQSMKEWIGLMAYWATDRSDALFPAPK